MSSAAVARPLDRGALRTLYVIRFGFAVAWGVLVLTVASMSGAALTALVVLYPLVDAASVLWQLRSERDAQASRVPEWINVATSILAAAALGWAATASVTALVAIWGAWAIIAGAVQLVAALLRRSIGGQLPLIISGGLSVLVGVAFLVQSAGGVSSAGGVGGYAIGGAVFFGIAAIRLAVIGRRS